MSGLPLAFRRASVPLGLIGMVALVAAVEVSLAHNELGLTTRVALSWKYSGALAPRIPGTRILCLGTSLVKCGLLPSILEERTGRRTWNLAPFGGSLPANYYVLKRHLRAGGRPAAIVLDCQDSATAAAESPERQAQVYLFDSRVWADLLDARETFDLAVSAHDASFFARTTVARMLPSCKARFEIREVVRGALAGHAFSPRATFRQGIAEWARQHGTEALVDVESPVSPDPASATQSSSGAESAPPPPRDGLTALYIRRLLALCAAHDLTVFWLLPPIRPDCQAIRVSNGDDGQVAGMARYAQSIYSRVFVVDGRRSGYNGRAFRDICHLNRSGALAYSAAVAEITGRVLDHQAASDRWMALPSYRDSLELAAARSGRPAPN